MGFRSGSFFSDGSVFPGVDLTQQFWSRPDNAAIAIHDERDREGAVSASRAALVMALALSDVARTARACCRRTQKFPAILHRRHRSTSQAELRPLRPETQQFLTGQFDG